MIKNFGDLCDLWVTFNEPELLVMFAYLMGRYPPYKISILKARRAINNIVESHNQAYELLKKMQPQTPVGIAKSEMCYRGDNFFGSLTARFWDWIINVKVHKAFANTDFVGINYYGKVTFNPLPLIEVEDKGILDKHRKKHDDMWEYAPLQFYRRLKKLGARYNKPIHVTENGCCTKNDNLRIRYIRAHLYAIKKAIKEGVDVRSYFYWSTFDNFELALGMSYKFGLVDVDPLTKRREIKPSGHFYAKLRKNNV
jgi:beta-glucosidase